MSSKLREDLPYSKKEWGDRAVEIFNQWRDDYKQGVKVAKKFYGDRAFIADGESLNHNSTTKLLMMMVEQGAKIAQLLVKSTTNTANIIKLTRAYDVITAFYVPEDVEWLKVISNGLTIGWFHGRYRELDLEDLLEQSWSMPESADESFLEYILWVSRQGKIGFVHNQEEDIEIDGVNYRRLIFMQPMLPIVQCAFTEVTIETSGPCTVYLEVSTCEGELRANLGHKPMTGWVEDLDDGIPLIQFSGGMVGKRYMMDKENGVDSLPTLELPSINFDPPDLGSFDLGSFELDGPDKNCSFA